MPRSVAFCTLGCKVNSYETDAMREKFQAAGYEVRDFSEEADVYVVNTCTVTNMADRKSRQMLHRAKKKNPEGLIVAVGCYAQAAGDKLKEDPMIDVVIGNNNKTQICEIVEGALEEKMFVLDIAHEQSYESMTITTVSEHTRAYIKIQDGCNQFCSYCIIPYARGRVRSRQIEEVIGEVKGLVASGYREIVLTGIHISSYGLDFEHRAGDEAEEDYGPFANSALIDLMEALSAIDGLERIRFGSLEPRIITEGFLDRLAKIPQICPHFHLSLQSGCDETLRRMNRHYSAALFLEKCHMIRRYFKNPAITTDVIVGFPGETEEEFATTEAFLEEVAFAEMHIFKYSKRAGTRAATMPNQVDPKIQTVRSDRLLALSSRLHDAFIEACKEEEVEVLLEELAEIDGKTYMTGHTRNYLRCAFEPDHFEPNRVIKGRIMAKLNDEFVYCQ